MNNENKNYGLRITWKSLHDPRKLSRKKYFGAVVDVSKITDFDLDPNSKILNQLSSSFCTAFSNAGISSIQEGVELSPEYAYQKSKVLMGGDPHSFGADPDSAMKAHCKFGCIEQKDNPYKLAEKGYYFTEDPKNWDKSLDDKAIEHEKKSYMECDQAGNRFDSILVAMWESYQAFLATGNLSKKKAVSTGFYWQSEWTNQAIIKDTGKIDKNSPHNVFAKGQKTIDGVVYCKIQNSYGEVAGDKGCHYFPKEVINKYSLFAKTFEDVDPEEIKKLQWSLLAIMYDYLVLLSKYIKEFFKPEPVNPAPPQPTPTPQPEPKVSKLIPFAKAIESYENTAKWRNNPGAIRGTNGKFLEFKTYSEGFLYLCNYISRVAEGKHIAYPKGGETSMIQFFQIYSPVIDGNSPIRYCSFVCNQIGVSPEDKIKDVV